MITRSKGSRREYESRELGEVERGGWGWWWEGGGWDAAGEWRKRERR